MRSSSPRTVSLLAGTLLLAAVTVPAADGPNLSAPRVTQDAIVGGEMTLKEIRRAGLRMFTTPFNALDGYGDGPIDPADTVSPGGRPTLQGNGTFLRVNGLDAQTCLECHAFVSMRTSPPRLGIGGVGGSNNNAIIQPESMDPADIDLDGTAWFDGRFANPPFIFGAGGVELLAVEMTEDLQALRAQALASPGTIVPLVTKGVSFGVVVADGLGHLDTSGVEGIDPDLVVRPFGRKGEFFSTRDFDIGAMEFHFGMQPVEKVGDGIDADGDGVVNEILVGELSALHHFVSTIERPFMETLTPQALSGLDRFEVIGCSGCHVPSLTTRGTDLPLRFPQVPTDPRAHVYALLDLSKAPARFEKSGDGLVVPLFADLKRHDMGPGLAETFAGATEQQNREFTTARLWGIADTAPYLHDGRATTLTDAILLHGGEAQEERDAFAALGQAERDEILALLLSLRTPETPAADLTEQDDDRGRRRRELLEGGTVDDGDFTLSPVSTSRTRTSSR